MTRFETAWADFAAVPRLYATLVGHDSFEAVCPACRGFLRVTSEDGEASIICPSGCAASSIGDRLYSLRKTSNGSTATDNEAELEMAAQLLGLDGERIVRVWRPDAGAESPLTLELASDRRLRWDRQADMLKPRELAFPALALGFGPAKPLTQAQAQTVYRALVGACETLEVSDARDQAREWSEQFLGIADVMSIPPDADDVAAFAMLADFRDRRLRWRAAPTGGRRCFAAALSLHPTRGPGRLRARGRPRAHQLGGPGRPDGRDRVGAPRPADVDAGRAPQRCRAHAGPHLPARFEA